MKYVNPVVKGFYPDPSVCEAYGKFYLACSSFQYFPGVPLFESEDLVNWTQIGHVLTREGQVMLDKVRSSGGVYAPTLRFYDGRFYMVTNNNSTNENFYVYTDDIHGEWSDPLAVDQDGIDPSLYFEDGRAFFLSNGTDDSGVSGVVQCEIDIASGRKLSESRCIWKGSGGRYLESPHMYKIGDYYYVMAAEGGTEYGHMITCARSKSIWGPFESNPKNPVLTNRNKAPFIIQGIGHGDLIQGTDGEWYMLSLGFRQIDLWMPFHHLGREVFLTPTRLNDDGWFTVGDGTTDFSYEIPGDFVQEDKRIYTFENTDWSKDWCFLRKPNMANYELSESRALLKGSAVTLDDTDSPTFVALRQRDFKMQLGVSLTINGGRAGVSIYMDENEHYDLYLEREGEEIYAVLKLNIGGIKHIEKKLPIEGDIVRLRVCSDSLSYSFFVDTGDTQIPLGCGRTKYLSSEVCEGFTGVMLALFAEGDGDADFTELEVRYE